MLIDKSVEFQSPYRCFPHSVSESLMNRRASSSKTAFGLEPRLWLITLSNAGDLIYWCETLGVGHRVEPECQLQSHRSTPRERKRYSDWRTRKSRSRIGCEPYSVRLRESTTEHRSEFMLLVSVNRSVNKTQDSGRRIRKSTLWIRINH